MHKPARTITAVTAAIVTLTLLTAEGCDVELTYGTEWQGDHSACNSVDADAIVETVGGNVGGIDQEFGKVAPSDYTGHDGCTRAYVVDYLMPTAGTNNNPGWDWAWIHVASRIGEMTESRCVESWTSLLVYGYWEFQGEPHEKLLLETYRKGEWVGNGCGFGLPDNVWMSSAYTRVRAAAQHGYALSQIQPHYNYFVTNRGESD